MDLRTRLTFANTCSFGALVIALGCGSAYAADLVGTAQLRNGAVTTAKLAPGAVTGAKVRKRSLGPGVFAPGTLRRGPRGPAGPAGPAGRVIDVPYAIELSASDKDAVLTYPLPAGSWLLTTSVTITSTAVGGGDHPAVRCTGPTDRDGGTGKVTIELDHVETFGTRTIVSPVVSVGTSPETRLWDCALDAKNVSSAANVRTTSLMQRVAGFD